MMTGTRSMIAGQRKRHSNELLLSKGMGLLFGKGTCHERVESASRLERQPMFEWTKPRLLKSRACSARRVDRLGQRFPVRFKLCLAKGACKSENSSIWPTRMPMSLVFSQQQPTSPPLLYRAATALCSFLVHRRPPSWPPYPPSNAFFFLETPAALSAHNHTTAALIARGDYTILLNPPTSTSPPPAHLAPHHLLSLAPTKTPTLLLDHLYATRFGKSPRFNHKSTSPAWACSMPLSRPTGPARPSLHLHPPSIPTPPSCLHGTVRTLRAQPDTFPGYARRGAFLWMA